MQKPSLQYGNITELPAFSFSPSSTPHQCRSLTFKENQNNLKIEEIIRNQEKSQAKFIPSFAFGQD